jgi:hypothetical protein
MESNIGRNSDDSFVAATVVRRATIEKILILMLRVL